MYDADGNLISKTEEAYSSYRMTERVVRVGTKQPEPTPETPTTETPAETPPATETPAA